MQTSQPVKQGDLFILLAPTAISPELAEHHLALQAQFGGRRIAPVHYTCQRFIFPDESNLPGFVAQLKLHLAGFPPFPIRAYSIVTLYSEFRRGRVLKWRIDLSEPIQRLTAVVAATLTASGASSGAKSLYPPGWISSLITALEGIERMGLDINLDEFEIPQPLFVAEQVLLTRYGGHAAFTVVDHFPLLPPTP